MIERQVDLWAVDADARCITTNGTVRKDARAVMGRGCARECAERYFAVRLVLGRLLLEHGNHVQVMPLRTAHHLPVPPVVAFPVKHEWNQPADLELIRRSAEELVDLTGKQGWRRVVLPRPGCGNGKRTWEEVEPILRGLLDDRFLVVSK